MRRPSEDVVFLPLLERFVATRLRQVITALGVLVLLTPQTSHAQTPDELWVGFGLGVASLAVDGPTGTTAAKGHMGIGLQASEKVMLGVEGSFLKSRSGFQTQSTLGLVVHFFPSPGGWFFLKLGAGMGRLTQQTSRGKWTDQSIALFLGLGLEIPFGASTAIRPFANAGIGGSSIIWTLEELGVGLSWRPG